MNKLLIGVFALSAAVAFAQPPSSGPKGGSRPSQPSNRQQQMGQDRQPSGKAQPGKPNREPNKEVGRSRPSGGPSAQAPHKEPNHQPQPPKREPVHEVPPPPPPQNPPPPPPAKPGFWSWLFG